MFGCYLGAQLVRAMVVQVKPVDLGPLENEMLRFHAHHAKKQYILPNIAPISVLVDVLQLLYNQQMVFPGIGLARITKQPQPLPW